MATICYYKGIYFEWSTICDAPLTYGMTKEEFEEYYLHRNGIKSKQEMHERMARAEKFGHSFMHGNETLKEYLAVNRAGENEKCISFEEIMRIVRMQ